MAKSAVLCDYDGLNETRSSDAYLCSDRGILLPLIDESGWSTPVRAFLYLLGMLYTFVGISLSADIFMIAIEEITSQKVKVTKRNPVTGEKETLTTRVWNPTIANLTLMALGSSAPEILLNVIELVGNGFHAGDLGPSTIVGSAAFNLFVITAVCVMSISSPGVRKVEGIGVFAVTSVAAVFSYLWLLIVLVAPYSPNVVELWEAILTLVFFCMLVIGAYIADKMRGGGCFGKRGKKQEEEVDNEKIAEKMASRQKTGDLPKEEVKRELALANPGMGINELARLTALRLNQKRHHDFHYYRILNSKWLSRTGTHKSEEVPGPQRPGGERETLLSPTEKDIVEFEAARYAASENDEIINLNVLRKGKCKYKSEVYFETIAASADSGEDFKPRKGVLVFPPGESIKKIAIPLIQDNREESDEIFYVRIEKAHINDIGFQIGSTNVAEITVLDRSAERPCTFSLEKSGYITEESFGSLQIPVIRSGNFRHEIDVHWKTQDITANEGLDYIGKGGVIRFKHGEVIKNIDIKIIDDLEVEKHERFKVILTAATKSAKISPIGVAVVVILGDERVAEWFGQADNMVEEYLEDMGKLGSKSWKDQFRRALNVNEGDLDEASWLDYIFHVVSFGWKIVFAFAPPVEMLGGWMTFLFAFTFIAILTAVVGDFAGIFGCLVGLEDAVTAITLVAIGTSLPDLFASRTAANNEQTADSSIGNINGSNSVNVFLGLGLPWVIATAYWTPKGREFCVKAGSLSFSVAIFTVFALTTLGVLILRRRLKLFGKGELGGPKAPKIVSGIFLCLLWLCYFALSTMEIYGVIDGF